MERRVPMPAISKKKTSSEAKAAVKAKNSKESMIGRVLGNSSVNLWGMAGRQEIMEMRRLLQLRIIRPCNLRG
jgi:hypothetical protein